MEDTTLTFYKNERFRTIEGFEQYMITDYGRVLSNTKNLPPRFLKPQKDSLGYMHVRLYTPDIEEFYSSGYRKPKLFKVHRLVAKYFCRKKKTKDFLEVNHKDGVKDNNHYTNLEYVTRKENMKHAWKNNLMQENYYKGIKKNMIAIKVTLLNGEVKEYQCIQHCLKDMKQSQNNITRRLLKPGWYGNLGYKVDYLYPDGRKIKQHRKNK